MKEIIEKIERMVDSMPNYAMSLKSIAKELKEYDEWPYKGARDVCWYCGGKLVWQNDFSYDDVYGEGEGIVTYLMCSECGARVQYEHRDDEEEEE